MVDLPGSSTARVTSTKRRDENGSELELGKRGNDENERERSNEPPTTFFPLALTVGSAAAATSAVAVVAAIEEGRRREGELCSRRRRGRGRESRTVSRDGGVGGWKTKERSSSVSRR